MTASLFLPLGGIKGSLAGREYDSEGSGYIGAFPLSPPSLPTVDSLKSCKYSLMVFISKPCFPSESSSSPFGSSFPSCLLSLSTCLLLRFQLVTPSLSCSNTNSDADLKLSSHNSRNQRNAPARYTLTQAAAQEDSIDNI